MSKLSRLRAINQIKLREIAEALNITPQAVQRQERRGIRKRKTAEQYAIVLGRHWAELMD